MKSASRKIFAFGRLHFVLTALFLYLIFTVHWIPQDKILAHAELSRQLLTEFSWNNYLLGDTLSMESEAESLTALAHDPEYSTIWNALLGQDHGFRWNGIQVLFLPLLHFFQIRQIRYLCMIFFFMLFFGAAWRIGKTCSALYGFFFLFSFLWADILSVSWLLPQTGCFLVTFCSILVLSGKKPAFWKENLQELLLVFYGIGGVTAFVDMGTVPVITLGFPLTFVFLSLQKYAPEQKPARVWKSLISCTVSWSLGHLFLTVTKWILTVFATGKNFFPEYMTRIKEEHFISSLSSVRIKELFWNNLNGFVSRVDFGRKILLFLLLAIIAVYGVLFFISNHVHLENGSAAPGMSGNVRQNFVKNLPLLFLGLLPFLFYFLAPASGSLHPGVTFRALAASFYPFALFFLNLLDLKRINQSLHGIWKSFRRN